MLIAIYFIGNICNSFMIVIVVFWLNKLS